MREKSKAVVGTARVAAVGVGETRSHLKMSTELLRLPQNARVRLSPLGAVRCRSLAFREGIVVGSGRSHGTVRVMFDGFKSPTSLHETYLELVPGFLHRPAK